MGLQYSDYLNKNLLQVAIATAPGTAVAGPLWAAHVGLFVNDPTLSPDTLLSDLTEADATAFPGYARATATWSAVYDQIDGSYAAAGNRQFFQPTSNPPSPLAIHGYFLTDSAGTHLLGSEKFGSPKTVTTTDDAVVFVPEVALGEGDSGNALV